MISKLKVLGLYIIHRRKYYMKKTKNIFLTLSIMSAIILIIYGGVYLHHNNEPLLKQILGFIIALVILSFVFAAIYSWLEDRW